MDPICHTLVGASLGCTGLQNKTRYSRVTLIVAANLPDIDVIAHFLGGAASYGYRRGITHGIPALIVLPILLAAAIYAWSRLRQDRATDPPTSFRWLLILSAIGVVSHPVLDWMNTYGMRWLMPVVDRWFYGDTLFIIDWVAWLVLLTGVIASRFVSLHSMRWFARPASVSLGILIAYIGMNFAITQLAVRQAISALPNNPPQRILASPVPVNPFRREIVLEYADEYRFGSFAPFQQDGFVADGPVVAKGDPKHLAAAGGSVDGRWFINWVRFPYSISRSSNGQKTIVIADARYVRDINNPRLDGFAIFEFEAPQTNPTAPTGR